MYKRKFKWCIEITTALSDPDCLCWYGLFKTKRKAKSEAKKLEKMNNKENYDFIFKVVSLDEVESKSEERKERARDYEW